MLIVNRTLVRGDDASRRCQVSVNRRQNNGDCDQDQPYEKSIRTVKHFQQIAKWIGQTTWRAGWAPLLIFAAHVVASVGFDAYRRHPFLDVPMHFVGGVAIAYFFHHATSSAPRFGLTQSTDAVTHWILVCSLTCSSAVFWEFGEFVSDRYFATKAQLGLQDSLGDMCNGLLGGVAFCAIAILRARRAK